MNVEGEESVPGETAAAPPAKAVSQAQAGSKKERREIPGKLPYSSSPNIFSNALEKIITAARPDKFSQDFMSTVLNISGGSSRPIPPLLKKMGFISSDGVPTDLYSRFKSDSARSHAALEGARNAFPEIFKRNEYAYRLEEKGVIDIVIEITGLPQGDDVIGYIVKTFLVICKHITFVSSDKDATPAEIRVARDLPIEDTANRTERKIGISYNINIVLPETENISVYDAIFKSLKSNMLE